MEDEQAYGRIDQEEIDKLLAEPSDINYNKNSNPTNNDDPLSDDGNNDTEEVPGKRTSVSPTITQTEPYRWTYSQKQTTKPKKVKFYDEEWHKLEVCHRLKNPTESKPKGRQRLHSTNTNSNGFCNEQHQQHDNGRRSKF